MNVKSLRTINLSYGRVSVAVQSKQVNQTRLAAHLRLSVLCANASTQTRRDETGFFTLVDPRTIYSQKTPKQLLLLWPSWVTWQEEMDDRRGWEKLQETLHSPELSTEGRNEQLTSLKCSESATTKKPHMSQLSSSTHPKSRLRLSSSNCTLYYDMTSYLC